MDSIVPGQAVAGNGGGVLQAPLQPYFWKPENDNQHAARFAQRTAVWKDLSDSDISVNYTIINSSSILVDVDFHPTSSSNPVIPKLGMRMRLPADMTSIEYYGRGPWENYPDRKDCAFVGCYNTTVSGMQEEYIKPQSMGERCDVNWLQLTDNKGKGGQQRLRNVGTPARGPVLYDA